MKKYQTESTGRYFSHFHRLTVNHLSKELSKYQIGYGQFQFLVQLYFNDGISHDELTELVLMDKASTTRAVKKLEEVGYVRTVLNEEDKRKYFIYLTEKAKAQKEEMFEIARKWEHDFVSSLSKNELDVLYKLLRKVAKNNKGYFFEKLEKM